MSTNDDPPQGSPSPPPSEPSIIVEPEPAVAPAPEPELASSDRRDPPAAMGRPFASEASAPVSSSPSAAAGASVESRSDDEAILPASYDEDSLRNAVGPPPKKPRRAQTEPTDSDVDDDGEPVTKSKKTIIVIALSLIVGLGIVALVLLGRVNSERYLLTCTTTQAIAEQGRAFPPWGSKPLSGAQWRPIALPANAQCKPQELDGRDKLEAQFLELLLERTSAALTVRNFIDKLPADAKPGASPLDTLAAQLEQALLLSRSPERGDQRKQVERLLGDVQYWRASLRLRDATAALVDASRQFDAAALQRPLHVSDAGAWAEFLRRLGDELQAGPNGATAAFPPAPTGEQRVPAPQGTALPVEPEPAAQGSDAPASPPDAGVPTGGVLL